MGLRRGREASADACPVLIGQKPPIAGLWPADRAVRALLGAGDRLLLVAAPAGQRPLLLGLGDDGGAVRASAFAETPPLAGGALSAAGLLAVPAAGGVAVGDVELWAGLGNCRRKQVFQFFPSLKVDRKESRRNLRWGEAIPLLRAQSN